MIEFGFKLRIYCRMPTDNRGLWDDEKRKRKSSEYKRQKKFKQKNKE